MAEARKTRGASRHTAWIAVLISLALHAPLLLAFFLQRQQQSPREGQHLDSRVTLSDAFLLRFDSSSPRPGQKDRVPDFVDVRVEQAPANAVVSDLDSGPRVDVKAMPGVRGVPWEGAAAARPVPQRAVCHVSSEPALQRSELSS